MREAEIFVFNRPAGLLKELAQGSHYHFAYFPDYNGPPISLTMPVAQKTFVFKQFPPFFEGLLPEGYNLEALLRTRKLDRDDLFGQLLAVGQDMVGAVTARRTG